jgi:NitT/TauT family transport system ATP-binding protein
VRVRGVEKHFGTGVSVLGRLELSVREGEFTAIVGPSGCGKSTLLRLVAGLETPDTGSLLVDGLCPRDATHEVAFVFQDPTLLPWLKASENVRLLLELRGIPPSELEQRTLQALELVRLSSHAGHYPRQLSGGQRMRVSLARALALSPRLLLLDEPFAALDELTREALNEELLALRALQRWTALFVTHSVSEAVFLSDRVLVMGQSPAGLIADIAVELPARRDEATRRSAAYLDLVSKISGLLRAQTREGRT